MPEIADKVPVVSLPLKLQIVKHPKEVEGKSTAVHAAVIANQDTTVYTWPDIPLFDPRTTLLIFPCDESVTLEQLAQECAAEKGGVRQGEKEEVKEDGKRENGRPNDSSSPTPSESQPPPPKRPKLTRLPYDSVVFIESTWNQAHSIFIDERLQKLKRIQLSDYETHFWRYQRGKPTSFLSTIEAIYWFFVEFDQHFGSPLATTFTPTAASSTPTVASSTPTAASATPSSTPTAASSTFSAAPSTPTAPFSKRFDNLLFFFSYMHSKIFKMYDGKLKVTEEKRQRLADRQKEEAKAIKVAEANKEREEEEKKESAALDAVKHTRNCTTEPLSEATI